MHTAKIKVQLQLRTALLSYLKVSARAYSTTAEGGSTDGNNPAIPLLSAPTPYSLLSVLRFLLASKDLWPASLVFILKP